MSLINQKQCEHFTCLRTVNMNSCTFAYQLHTPRVEPKSKGQHLKDSDWFSQIDICGHWMNANIKMLKAIIVHRHISKTHRLELLRNRLVQPAVQAFSETNDANQQAWPRRTALSFDSTLHVTRPNSSPEAPTPEAVQSAGASPTLL